MAFELKFKTDNAAFCDGNGDAEIASILRKLADSISAGGRDDLQIYIPDSNGNIIGHCYFTLPMPEQESD